MYTTEVDQARKMKAQGNMNRVLLYNVCSYVAIYDKNAYYS